MNELILTAIIYLYGSCADLSREMDAHGVQSVSDIYDQEAATLIVDVCGFEQ